MSNVKKYLYCIISAEEPVVFKIRGMSGAGRVYTVNYNDIAAVVSDSTADRFSLSRENLLTHQKVLEEVMRNFTLLPVKFGTQSDSAENIAEYVLKKRYRELRQSLNYFKGKNQMSLKVLWNDMPALYRELADSDQILKKIREDASPGVTVSKNYLIEIGQYVEQLLASRKEAERERIITALQKYVRRAKVKDNYGDEMFVNADFLVDLDKQELFDEQLEKIAGLYGPRAHFRYVGPMPPYDFVQIYID